MQINRAIATAKREISLLYKRSLESENATSLHVDLLDVIVLRNPDSILLLIEIVIRFQRNCQNIQKSSLFCYYYKEIIILILKKRSNTRFRMLLLHVELH